MDIHEILKEAISAGASDVHMIPGLKPLLRVHTVIQPLEDYPEVMPEDTERCVREMLGEQRYKRLVSRRDIDFSAKVDGYGRFRVNAHYQREMVAIAFRAVPNRVPALEELNLPPILQSLSEMRRGLVLVTGQTGHGKSTTLASMIDSMNKRFGHHIITLEDPVEYELHSNKCVIEQRELGPDVPSFASGLRHALRQDPDIILVGEMRDLETTSSAITAAETGHLVLSTMHTFNASQTVERIIDIYPSEQQNQVRSMLANTLQAVISMVLFKRADAPGMIPACEVMVCTPAVRNCIRTARIHEIPNIIQTGASVGMCTMDDAIKDLFATGKISSQQAAAHSARPDRLSETVPA